MPELSDTDLRAMLAAEKADALAAVQSSKLSKERSDALDYYMGDVSADIPNETGKSSAVSSDVADTIEGLMPALMEIFCGGDEVVKFSPVGPEDVKPAEQETDYVNHVFMQLNPGFLALYSFIKDALLSKVGIVKVWTEEEEKEDRQTYLDQPEDAYAILTGNPELEVVEHTEHDGLHDVTVVCRKKYKRHKVEPVPPEEFGIARRAKSIKGASYCFHETVTTVGDLIEQGYDEAQVKALPTEGGLESTEQAARDSVDEQSGSAGDEGLNSTTRPVKVTEHYVRMDYRGNGKASLYRVKTGGEQGDVLKRDGKPDLEEVDYAPFAAMTPVIITHRFFGRSIADLVMDIMRIKTALLRGMLNNLYLHNNPRVEVAQSHSNDQTLDDLLVSRPGGIVRTKQPGGLQWQNVPDITASIYPALEYFDATREWRTGVTRQGQGIDADALQNQSATAVNQAFTAAQARMKLIARIFAETGIRDLFSLLHAEIRKHGDQAQTVRLRNEWVTVDPQQWKTRNDMTINVGLGSGSKSERVSHLMALISLQKEALLAGKTNLVTDDKLFNSAKELAKLLEYKDAEQFFNDPSAKDEQGQLKHPPAPPPPNPDMLKIQADAAAKDKELQFKGQELQVKAAIDQQADQRKAQIETVQAQADIATQDRKMQAEMAMAERKAQLEERLMLLDHELKREMQTAELEMKREQHQQALQSGAFKVAADAESHEQKMAQAKAKPKAKA
jgi:hypothetical protein